MDVLTPASGARLPIHHPIVFTGTAPARVVRVELVADSRFPIGGSAVSDGKWTVARLFSSPGTRSIVATGFDASDAPIESRTLSIVLQAPHHFGYTPPAATLAHLADIALLLEDGDTRELTSDPKLAGLNRMFQLKGGALFFDSDLDLDTDGERDPDIVYEPTHQDQTSLRFPGGRSLNANTIPFFVLPGGFGGQLGIQLGDIAAVLHNGHLEFAVFADTGPRRKIGEGSIALHRALGFERVRANGRIRDIGIDRDVLTIVFPGSGNGEPQTPDAIRALGRERFTALGGAL